MLYDEQFGSEEAYLNAGVPDTEHEIVRKAGREAATESFVNHVDITDLSTADPKGAARHSEEYHDMLEERLGRLPTKDELDRFLSAYETEYERRMVKSGMVATLEDARA